MEVVNRKEARALKLKRYFTGIPCKNGHTSEKFTVNGTCVTCFYIRNKKYTDNHLKEISEYKKKHYKLNKNNYKTHHRNWKIKNNPDFLKKEFYRKKRLKIKNKAKENGELCYFTGVPCIYGHISYRYVSNDTCKECTTKIHSKRHKGIRNANSKAYRVRKIQRLPKWANLNTIKNIYKNCPEGMVVDHIIPLQGENVCGLHVENNLQYLTISENTQKGNKFVSEII